MFKADMAIAVTAIVIGLLLIAFGAEAPRSCDMREGHVDVECVNSWWQE